MTAFVGSVPTPGFGSHVEILSNCFIGNDLLLKLLKTIFLELNNNPKLSLKNCFSTVFQPLSKFFVLAAILFCLSSASFNDKCPACISLKKQ